MKPIIFSFGGGRQTIAMSVLIAQGKLPKPERVVMADTGREASETWEYAEAYVKPLLATVGLEIEIAEHDLSTVDMYGKNGDVLIPAFTEDGKLPTLCSTEWKKRVVQRYLRQQGYGPENPVIMWIGISRDEAGRMKPSDVKWQEYRYPLAMDLRMTVHDCQMVIERAGLPPAPQSSCVMCPHRQNSQWQRLQLYPADWQQALDIDEQVYESHGVRLHRSGLPLAEADLSVPDLPLLPLFGQMEDGCKSPQCMV